MPENEVQDTQAPEAASVSETKAQKFERERYTRRQALRKMGMTTAMATFAMFSVDDLAHMVGNALQKRAGDSQVAEQIAKEFQQAGIAMAISSTSHLGGTHCYQHPSGGDCTGCSPSAIGPCCQKSPNKNLCCFHNGNAQQKSDQYIWCMACCESVYQNPSSSAFNNCANGCQPLYPSSTPSGGGILT